MVNIIQKRILNPRVLVLRSGVKTFLLNNDVSDLITTNV